MQMNMMPSQVFSGRTRKQELEIQGCLQILILNKKWMQILNIENHSIPCLAQQWIKIAVGLPDVS